MNRCLSIIFAVNLIAFAANSQTIKILAPNKGMFVENNKYYIQNNAWGAGANCTTWSETDTVKVNDDGSWSVTANCNYPLSCKGGINGWPSIYYGSFDQGKSAGWTEPEINKFSQILVDWTISVNLKDAMYDVSFDHWIYKNNLFNEVMIWIAKSSNMYTYGNVVASNISINGSTWDLFRIWHNNEWWYNAFVIKSGNLFSVKDFDQKPFFDFLASKGYIDATWRISALEAGTEIVQGTGTVTTSNYAVNLIDAGPTGGTSIHGSDNINKEKTNSSFVKIFPNPATDTIKLQFAIDFENVTYKLSDLNGKLLYSNQLKNILTGSETKIDCSSYAQGLYILSVKSDHYEEQFEIMLN